MPACSPQRYLANNRNLVRTATLTPSSVLPVADSVLELPVGRVGTGQVLLTGDYAGEEEATFDIEVVDNIIDVPLVSVPIRTGAGSGALTGIASSGTAQTYTVQLQNAGIPELRAGIDFEGVRIVARANGDAGNGIEIEIDQTTLVFTEQNFSLLTELNPGDGGETTGIKGAAFDWQTKVLSSDNIIPADAHRVAFGEDTSDVYLQYKKYVDGEWFYHFVPAIKRHIPKGERISFVTGGRAVTVTPLIGAPETFPGIATVYDLLNAFFATSAIVSVEGVIAYDRSPTGQAAKELLIRTDAHCERSTGTGSTAATGFVDTFANPNAATELVIARCVAASSVDHPLARPGATIWDLNGSVSGSLGEIVEGVPFVDPDGKFGATIPQKLPDNYGVQRGRFSVVDIIYVPRDEELQPPICPVALELGTEAVDQTITLKWTKRPSGDCACKKMPIPHLSQFCLGLFSTEGGTVGLQADTITRLVALYAYQAAVVRSNSATTTVGTYSAGTPTPMVESPQGLVTQFDDSTPPTPVAVRQEIMTPDSFLDIIAAFAGTVEVLDPITDTTLRADGMSAWDDAFTDLQNDIDDTTPELRLSVDSHIYNTKLQWVLASGGVSSSGGDDASVLISGDGCWRDWGGDFWSVVGSVKGAYAPIFNNHPFYLSRLAEDGKTYFSTKEAGGQINIKCENLLVYGDQIVLAIGDAGWGTTYQTGDELTLALLAAQPLVLAGGQDPNDLLDWYVSGSLDGALANLLYDPSDTSPGFYNSGGLTFTYTPGGIPNKAGDKFVFTVEGGHWRYRKNGGGWILNSPSDDIDDAVLSFVDGLSIQWQTGAAPSFAVGDRYSFRVFQPWAVSNLQSPHRDPWKWDEAAPSVVIDTGSVQPITALAIYRHTIPAGATIEVDGGDVAGVYLWTETLTWSAGDIFKEVAQSARYLRPRLTNALGGGIAWFWAGVPVTTSLSAEVDLRRAFKLDSSAKGLAQGGNYLGKAYSGEITWTEGALKEDPVLTNSDIDNIGELLDWGKTHGDEPFLLVPNNTRPDEVYAAIIAVDEVDFDEQSKYNRLAAFDGTPSGRRYSLTLPFAGVWRQ